MGRVQIGGWGPAYVPLLRAVSVRAESTAPSLLDIWNRAYKYAGERVNPGSPRLNADELRDLQSRIYNEMLLGKRERR